jgi:ElaB/YqjD/DUF883 family membrane-anchored ribosome-binding protein
MSNDFSDFTERAKRMAAESSEELKEKLSSMASAEDLEKLKESAGEMAEEAAAFIRKHPLPSVFGALAAGFLLGAFFNRKS